MSRLSARAQLYIAIAVVAVVAVAAIFLGILPQFQAAATVNDQISTEQSNLSSAQALLARRQSAKAQSAASEVELMRIANQVPDSPQLPSVIIELQDVANAAAVDFQSISPGEPTPPVAEAEGVAPPDYTIVPMTLLVRGDWAELIDFFRRIDDLDRGVRVTGAKFLYVPELESTDGSFTPAYVEANVTLEVYVMDSVTSLNAPAGSTTATTTP